MNNPSSSPAAAGGPPANARDVSLALAGSGGAGVMTAGTLLLEAVARAGGYGQMVRTSGPQIRGGESAALLRFGAAPVTGLADRFDVLIALDFGQIERFVDEIPLDAGSVALSDAEEADWPAAFARSGARRLRVPIGAIAKAVPGSWPNMVALGVAAGAIGVPLAAVETVVEKSMKRGRDALAASLAACREGHRAAAALEGLPRLPLNPPSAERWLITGNEAAGLGALRAGVRFVAAYPITPATELLEWMAPALSQVGGTLVQAEDELASVNMAIGAAYAGVPALTATAGPGLSLMTEALGLAVTAEIPLVVVDVMRGGPSTGIPAKTEQSDLNLALWGLHGDAPRIVVAPNSITDCVSATQWAVTLAEGLQSPVLVLSDQFLGQTRAVIDPPPEGGPVAQRLIAQAPAVAESGAGVPPADSYRRYRDTADGVSPMAIPGAPGLTYTAEGLEHSERGLPSSGAADHRRQLDKRLRKIDGHDYGERWADIEGDGELALITFGSSTAPAREALARLRAEGVAARLISLRLLLPARPEAMARALAGVRRALVVELNHAGQLYRFLRAHYDLPATRSHARPGPLPLRPGELADALRALARPSS